MRSCIYCGRELEKGEVCTCPQSAAHRAQKTRSASDENKQTQQNNQNYGNPFRTETSYKTGYSVKESWFEKAKAKRKAKQAARKSQNINAKGFFSGLWRYIIEFVKSPVDKISNPGHLGKGSILSIAAIQGAVLWLCIFFIQRGGAVGPLKLIASMMNFGDAGQNLIVQMLLCALSGALSGLVLFFLYSGIFYLINRFIMRLKTAYWDFSVRLAATWIPFTVICAVGVILSMLSPVTLFIMLLCGAASVAVLTYEALRTEWLSHSPSKVMYAMMLGYFIFFTVVCYLLFI